MAVSDANDCCEACRNRTTARKRCVAWSAFHDRNTLQCFLFDSVGKVNFVKGCVSGGAHTPAPAPASFSGEVVRLSSLQLDESKEWLVKSLWDPGEPVVRVSNGSFVSRPGYHDVGMYIITRGHGQ
jgi:hypothetical protein